MLTYTDETRYAAYAYAAYALHMHAYAYAYAATACVCMRMQVVDGAALEVRATLDVKQTVSFATVADELKELCKAPCVFRYQSQRRVACDRHTQHTHTHA